MTPKGKWNGIKHYSKVAGLTFDDFSELINVDVIDNIKYNIIGKNGYVIEIRQHPSSRLEDKGLCSIENNVIALYVPEKLMDTDTRILFFAETEIEFNPEELAYSLANETKSSLEHIWNNSLPIESYRYYLKKTIKWD